ncbi:MAG: alpha/beta hydrolase domain-containing protein [Gammaproteobacteria bacterium]|nr:alpha/beta hydrolase domain-containing protein [Gammaproteobacteria bacterium]
MPQSDEDGNALGGVRLPDIQVPTGTHGGQNTPLTDRGCVLSGSFIPFAKTKQQRLAANDNRLSIEERYLDNNDYVNRIAVSAWSLVAEGFMLEQDAIIVIHAASQSPVFRPPNTE